MERPAVTGRTSPAAGLDPAHPDAIADLEVRDARAQRLDDAGDLVAEDDRGGDGKAASVRVSVGAAQAHRDDTDQDLAGAGRDARQAAELERRARAAEDDGAHAVVRLGARAPLLDQRGADLERSRLVRVEVLAVGCERRRGFQGRLDLVRVGLRRERGDQRSLERLEGDLVVASELDAGEA